MARLYVAKKFEDNLWKCTRDQAHFLKESALGGGSSDATGMNVDSRAYACDYIEGYPGWRSHIEGGKMILFREKSGKNMLVFKSPSRSKEIVIPAQNINEATIISKKKGLHEHDLMIQLDCKDDSGRRIKPVFNLHDDIIRGVRAGINEIVGEDKVLRSFEQVQVSTSAVYCTSCGSQIPKEAKFCSSCGQKQPTTQ